MLRTFFSKFVYIIIGLALVGLIAQLFTNTSGFLKSIFLTIGIAAALSLVVYFLFLKTRKPGNEMKKYRKAVKQSARKYKTKTPEIKKKPQLNRLKQTQVKKRNKSRKGPSHLRVIDGNKSKRNKRMSN